MSYTYSENSMRAEIHRLRAEVEAKDARIAEIEQQRGALVEALEDLCAQLGKCGMTERARATLRAAGVATKGSLEE